MADNTARIGTFGHGFTGSGHPVATAVALENLKIIEERDLFGNAKRMGEILQRRLAGLADHPLVGEARGTASLGPSSSWPTRRREDRSRRVGRSEPTHSAAQANGLIVRAIGDVLAVCPPLIINEEQVNELANRLEKALDATAEWVGAGNTA